MKIYKIAKSEHWEEMKEWNDKRTNNHIKLVRKYCKKIRDKFDEFLELEEREKVHDDSKFKEPEYTPYVYLTWRYKCKDDGKDFNDYDPPENIDDKIHEATMHHITTNSHHPEYHADEVHLNKENRDKPPKEVVDATKMPRLDVAEMVADWSAMSEERGNTPKSWADKNVNIRWKFTDEQKDLIYELIEAIWDDK